MYDNEFFVVDMASCTSTGEIINNLSLALETLNHSEKKIVLKLNDTYFNQSQMLSMQSLITSYGCTLDTIETNNENTVEVAQNMNILVQKPIERRVNKNTDSKVNEFQPFTIGADSTEDAISYKDVNGLHFEADLDAIQNAQDKIDVKSDLREAGVDLKSDFNEIEEQIYSKYTIPKIPYDDPSLNTSLQDNVSIAATAKMTDNQVQDKLPDDEYENAEKKINGRL